MIILYQQFVPPIENPPFHSAKSGPRMLVSGGLSIVFGVWRHLSEAVGHSDPGTTPTSL